MSENITLLWILAASYSFYSSEILIVINGKIQCFDARHHHRNWCSLIKITNSDLMSFFLSVLTKIIEIHESKLTLKLLLCSVLQGLNADTHKHIQKKKHPVLLSQVGCATTCCPWRIGRILERAAGPDSRSMTTASLCLEAPSLSPAATSTLRYWAPHANIFYPQGQISWYSIVSSNFGFHLKNIFELFGFTAFSTEQFMLVRPEFLELLYV